MQVFRQEGAFARLALFCFKLAFDFRFWTPLSNHSLKIDLATVFYALFQSS